MSVKTIYSCDICREMKEPKHLWGVNFSTLGKFKLDGPKTTGGVHICMSCAEQLKAELNRHELG